MQSASLIGFGRFGELWAKFLSKDFKVAVYDKNPIALQRAARLGFKAVSLAEASKSEVIFFAVPISSFESSIKETLEVLGDRHALLVDLLSVKTHPKEIFHKYLRSTFSAMLCHPMFGPDSYDGEGNFEPAIVIDQFQSLHTEYNFWKQYFTKRGLKVVELSADEHDRLAAKSQGLTHFIGRVLNEVGLEPTKIDTLGARKLFELKEQVCNDAFELFSDLQSFNPHTRELRVKLGQAVTKISAKLIPDRIFKDELVIGLQGGRGSFNEEAALDYLNRNNIENYRLEYLYTSNAVLQALEAGLIDRGLFALHNSLGGIVHESIEAMAQFNFEIIAEISIKIAHALIRRGDADISEIDTIMTHPQVLKQCAKNLSRKYPNLRQLSGEGELIDHAKVSELMAQKRMPENIATMGSRRLAELHGLSVIEDNLQDLDENWTNFLLVSRMQV